MREFRNIFYIFGVIFVFIGFILYNYAISNDLELLTAALLIGIGVAALLTCYL